MVPIRSRFRTSLVHFRAQNTKICIRIRFYIRIFGNYAIFGSVKITEAIKKFVFIQFSNRPTTMQKKENMAILKTQLAKYVQSGFLFHHKVANLMAVIYHSLASNAYVGGRLHYIQCFHLHSHDPKSRS